jgi:hypothetical protein
VADLSSDIVDAIEKLEDRDLLRLAGLVQVELKDRVRIYRIMGRLTDKLALAAAVAPRQAAKIEARADKIIAAEPEIEKLTDDSFLPHEALLDEAQKSLNDLKHELATMSNNPPLSPSDGSSKDTPVILAVGGSGSNATVVPAPTAAKVCPRCAAGSIPIKRPDTGEWVHNISVQGQPGIGQTICLNPPKE